MARAFHSIIDTVYRVLEGERGACRKICTGFSLYETRDLCIKSQYLTCRPPCLHNSAIPHLLLHTTCGVDTALFTDFCLHVILQTQTKFCWHLGHVLELVSPWSGIITDVATLRSVEIKVTNGFIQCHAPILWFYLLGQQPFPMRTVFWIYYICNDIGERGWQRTDIRCISTLSCFSNLRLLIQSFNIYSLLKVFTIMVNKP